MEAVYGGKAISGEANHNWTGTAKTGSVEYNVNWDNVVSKVDAEQRDATKKTAQDMFDAAKEKVVEGGASFVFDNARWTVNGEHLTQYSADTDGDYAPDTNVMKANGDSFFFNESAECSAPYFDINIDGINLPA